MKICCMVMRRRVASNNSGTFHIILVRKQPCQSWSYKTHGQGWVRTDGKSLQLCLVGATQFPHTQGSSNQKKVSENFAGVVEMYPLMGCGLHESMHVSKLSKR